MAIYSKDQKAAFLKGAGIQELPKITIDDIQSFGNRDSLLEMAKNIAAYNKMLNEKLTLINESLTATIPFTRENLYLFCAFTGSGKSTVAANISYPLWKQGKKVLVISNEETKEDILFRIACLEKGYNFNDYKNGKMPVERQEECWALFESIADYVKICDVTWMGGITTKIEGVQQALEIIKGQGFSCALIDYFQLVKDSINHSYKSRYDALDALRTWLGVYIKSCEVPIALFVQLHSIGKKGGVKDIDARIKECPIVIEPASVIIEVVPNIEEASSDFIIHKNRFSNEREGRIICPYENGRFLKQLSVQDRDLRKAEVKRKKDAQNLAILQQQLQGINGDKYKEMSDLSKKK